YDSSSSGAKCPLTNQLKLGDNKLDSADNGEADHSELLEGPRDKCNLDQSEGSRIGLVDHDADHLCYFATQGAYDTLDDPRADIEGYVPIVYGDQFHWDFYNDAEIIATDAENEYGGVEYFAGNVLSPGSEIALTFKLGLPEPCVGNFDTGDIFFWGEAI
ncbi:hypothetical protein J4221_05110, partial [Candidatus Pacearchaeota archaeon]|nr:hypothetical protein [Candidatus Pacearchaeota archaeon]